MTVEEYADEITRTRMALGAMLAILPEGPSTLLRYEHLLFTRPTRGPRRGRPLE